jgi:transposase
VPRSCWRPMTIPNGPTSRSQGPSAAPTAAYASGVAVGSSIVPWKIYLVQVVHGFFPPEVRAQATALACSLPRTLGLPLARWSCAEIARQLIKLGLVAGIAVSTVWRMLRADRLKPWRYHSWQHILDPQAFLARARPILELYEQVQSLWSKGTWVVAVDEKTSIQARQAEWGPRPSASSSPVQTSPRYTRRGAVHLFAGLSVADGQVCGECLQRKRFVDFQAFLLQRVVPAALQRGVKTLALILDGGSTHAPKRLETWLAAQAEAHGWPFKVQVHWLPTGASWLNQIEIWFSVLQRKVLQPNHFTDIASLIDTVLAFIRRCNETPKPVRWSYTIQKLERKLGTN